MTVRGFGVTECGSLNLSIWQEKCLRLEKTEFPNCCHVVRKAKKRACRDFCWVYPFDEIELLKYEMGKKTFIFCGEQRFLYFRVVILG